VEEEGDDVKVIDVRGSDESGVDVVLLGLEKK